jgi:hypothetical protein
MGTGRQLARRQNVATLVLVQAAAATGAVDIEPLAI